MSLRRWWPLGLAKFILIVGVLYSAIVGFGYLSDEGFTLPSLLTALLTGFGGAAAVGLACFALQMLLLPRRARKAYKQMRIDGVTTEYEFDRQGFRASSSLGTSIYTWEHFVRWHENDRLLIMYRTDLLMVPLPKNQVEPAVLEALRAELRHAAVPTR
jgi:hypothetical protein